jgi:hypothetical protein
MTTRSRTKPAKKERPEPATNSLPLADEVRTYEAHLPEWTDREGQYVLIRGGDVLGFYSRHDEALEAGYARFGNTSFLVKQVLAHEPVYQLGQIDI